MSNGALIFAHNNQGIDYVKMAVFCASKIRQFLDIPVSIVTNDIDYLISKFPDHGFDKIIELGSEPAFLKKYHDGSLVSNEFDWKNTTRSSAYDLTPYDVTLVVDADYIINSSILKLAFDRDESFQIYHDSFDLADWRNRDAYQRINSYSIPFYWATVFVFRKDTVTDALFDLVDYIKSNWRYFRILYNIEYPLFRNDFAFSIAIHIMNGKTDGKFATELPGKMTYSLDKDLLISTSDDVMNFLIEKKDYLGEYIAAKTTGIDVHVMNKKSLLRYIDGGNGV
jgi:hypothetical protein